MDFKLILSGKNKPQILHLGFRFQWNKGPKGPNQTTYFKCVNKTCKATLATTGDIEGELALKFHNNTAHNHQADVSLNIVAETMHEYRQDLDKNPDQSAKKLFEDRSTKALDSVDGTPNKLDLAKKFPIYRNGNEGEITKKYTFIRTWFILASMFCFF